MEWDLIQVGVIFLACGIGVAITLYSYYRSKNNPVLPWFLPAPTHIDLRGKDRRELDEIIAKVRGLPIEKQILVVNAMYGRPLRIQLGCDSQRVWWEIIGPYTSMGEEDFNFQFMQAHEGKGAK